VVVTYLLSRGFVNISDVGVCSQKAPLFQEFFMDLLPLFFQRSFLLSRTMSLEARLVVDEPRDTVLGCM
jgi:hypothetical protein